MPLNIHFSKQFVKLIKLINRNSGHDLHRGHEDRASRRGALHPSHPQTQRRPEDAQEHRRQALSVFQRRKLFSSFILQNVNDYFCLGFFF